MRCVDSFKQIFKCECYQTFCIMGNLTQATMVDLTLIFLILDSRFTQELRIVNCVENQDSQRTVNLLLNSIVTV